MRASRTFTDGSGTIFEELAESEQKLQAYEIKHFSLIQLWFVYLSVYQLLDLTSRNDMARITNARY